MKKIFSFLCLIAAIVVAMSACSSTKEEKGTSETGNAALDNIFARKSVRTYLNKGVEKEKIDLMLRAGMAAPSGKDVRPWEFIVVSDRAKLDSMAAALPYAKMLTQARNAIIVCGDSVRSSYWYLDCSAAAQNILLAAESLGLGAVACYGTASGGSNPSRCDHFQAADEYLADVLLVQSGREL